MKKLIFTAGILTTLLLLMPKSSEAICTILPVEQFTTSGNFSTGSGTTSKYWSPASCTTGGLSYFSTGGCTGGYIGKTGSWNNYFGCFLRTPQADCSGNTSVTLNFDISNSYFSAHPNDMIRFYMWVDGAYKNATSVKIGGIDVGYSDINGLWLKFDQARTCVNVDVVFDLTTCTNLTNILFYLEPDCGYNDGSVFSVALDNISLRGSSVPIANAGNDVAVCSGLSTQLNATGGTSYAWSPSTGLSSTTAANPTANPTTTTTYYVTVSDACGSAVDSVVVNVNSIPATPVITPAGSTLNSSSPSGNQWYNSGGPIGGATGNSYSVTATDNYYVIITDGNGCISDTSNIVYVDITGIGISSSTSTSVCIFPDPATNIITIAAPRNAIINMVDIEGRQIKTMATTDNKTSVDVSVLPNGIYFIKVKTSESLVVKKFIKE